MRRLHRHKLAALPVLGGLALVLGAAFLFGDSAALFTTTVPGEDTARAAVYDVEITPPPGVYTADELGGGRNELYQGNTEYTEHIYTITNYSEVTVRVTPAISAANNAAWSMDTSPFILAAGEAYQLILVFEGGGTALVPTVEDIDLTLTIAQED